jgi:imidazolonepropionase-like amidohydrolase
MTCTLVRPFSLLLCALPWLAACSPREDAPIGSADAALFEEAHELADGATTLDSASSAVLFEGARLIFGDANAPLENSAFLVENGRFTAVARAGEIVPPTGATRIDLSGKTVMPALIDLHVHPGYADIEAMTDSPANYTRENLIDQLYRMAYYGIGTALSLGLDRGEMPLELREEALPGAPWFLSAGPGIAMPNAGPGAADRRDVPYGVSTKAEGRAAVRELAAKEVDIVKIWVDDRSGTVEKLTPALYAAVIDEAHKQGLKVAAHIFSLEDAKGLLRARVDVFAHGVRDTQVDEEFMRLLAERPEISLIPNLPASGRRTIDDLPFIAETLPAEQIDRMREKLLLRGDGNGDGEPSESFSVQARNLLRMRAAGVRIGFGTDGNGAGWQAHEELADMVAAGLSPADAIAAATGTSAAILGLEDRGTVSEGKSADFIVLNANPLDDIKNTRDIAGVYIRSERVDRAALRARWVGL